MLDPVDLNELRRWATRWSTVYPRPEVRGLLDAYRITREALDKLRCNVPDCGSYTEGLYRCTCGRVAAVAAADALVKKETPMDDRCALCDGTVNVALATPDMDIAPVPLCVLCRVDPGWRERLGLVTPEGNTDREPQPTDGPEYHEQHRAWVRRQAPEGNTDD